MTEPISWELAERIAVRVAGREPFADSYHYASLEPDFAEFTAEAEELVAAETGLRSLSGPARARVTDRAGWVRANLASFRRLLKPITEKLGNRMTPGPLTPVAQAITGAEVGGLLGGWRRGSSGSTTCSSPSTRIPRSRTSSTTSAPTSWRSRSVTGSRRGSSGCGSPST